MKVAKDIFLKKTLQENWTIVHQCGKMNDLMHLVPRNPEWSFPLSCSMKVLGLCDQNCYIFILENKNLIIIDLLPFDIRLLKH